MPKLIKLVREADGQARMAWAEDRFARLADDEAAGDGLRVIVSLARFQADGDRWLAEGRPVGVRLRPDEAAEGLAYDLPRLALVALEFPKFRDGRAYSSAMLLRGRLGYGGELRAVGDVLRDQAFEMVRCGFDAFEPADDATPEAWARAALRHRHVYQSAADGRRPAFDERMGG